MLTDWLIFLDFLEENNQNTTFLRLITPIIFDVIKCHYYNYYRGNGLGNNSYSDGNGYGYGDIYGNGYGTGSDNGNSYGYGYIYSNSYDEGH